MDNSDWKEPLQVIQSNLLKEMPQKGSDSVTWAFTQLGFENLHKPPFVIKCHLETFFINKQTIIIQWTYNLVFKYENVYQFSMVTSNVCFDRSFQHFVYYIISTVVHDIFISNKAANITDYLNPK